MARELPYAAWVTIQIGCDNSCAFCIVPAVRGPEISRPFGDLVDEVERLAADGVTEVTLLGQNVNSYGRDLTLRLRGEDGHGADAARLAGPTWLDDRRARPLFADLLVRSERSPGIRRVRYTSPHPKDLRPETIAAMADTPAVCEHLHLPLQSGSDRILAAMHRGYTAERYLERLAAARRRHRRPRRHHRHHRGLPRRDRGRLRGDAGGRGRGRRTTPPTRSSTRPVRAPRRRSSSDRFVDHAVAVERMERLRMVVERSLPPRNQARIGRTEEVLVGGPVASVTPDRSPAARRRTSSSTSPDRADPRRHPTPPSRSPRPACRA